MEQLEFLVEFVVGFIFCFFLNYFVKDSDWWKSVAFAVFLSVILKFFFDDVLRVHSIFLFSGGFFGGYVTAPPPDLLKKYGSSSRVLFGRIR